MRSAKGWIRIRHDDKSGASPHGPPTAAAFFTSFLVHMKASERDHDHVQHVACAPSLAPDIAVVLAS